MRYGIKTLAAVCTIVLATGCAAFAQERAVQPLSFEELVEKHAELSERIKSGRFVYASSGVMIEKENEEAEPVLSSKSVSLGELEVDLQTGEARSNLWVLDDFTSDSFSVPDSPAPTQFSQDVNWRIKYERESQRAHLQESSGFDIVNMIFNRGLLTERIYSERYELRDASVRKIGDRDLTIYRLETPDGGTSVTYVADPALDYRLRQVMMVKKGLYQPDGRFNEEGYTRLEELYGDYRAAGEIVYPYHSMLVSSSYAGPGRRDFQYEVRVSEAELNVPLRVKRLELELPKGTTIVDELHDQEWTLEEDVRWSPREAAKAGRDRLTGGDE